MSRRFCLLLSVVLLQTSCGSPTPPPSSQTGTAKSEQSETQVADLESKITKWQSNRDKLKKLLEQLQQDKRGVVQKLVQLGVKSENDLANSPKAQVLHGELKDIVKQAALCEKKFQDYDLAILKTESRVRSVARQLAAREAGVSDTELEELTRSMVTLDESLSSEKEPAVPIDLKDTLKDELARYHEQPEPQPEPEPKPKPKPEPQPERKPEQEPEPKPEPKHTEPAPSRSTGHPQAPSSPDFKVVWKGQRDRFIEVRVKQTTTSAVLVMKAHNFTDKQRADSFLDQVMKQIVDNWQTNVPQYKGKVIKVRKQEDHQSQDVLTRRIEFSVGKQ